MPRRLLLMLLGLIVTPVLASANGTYHDGLYYIFNSTDMTAEVTYGTTGTPNPTNSAYSSLPVTLSIPGTVTYDNKDYTVTSIGRLAFAACTGLQQVVIPNSVTSIGANAFQACIKLADITIPSSVISIDQWAFYGCASLTTVTLRGSAMQLGDNAFSDCSNLTTVACLSTTPPICGDDVFPNPEKNNLYVPYSAVNTYKNASTWSRFGTIGCYDKIGSLCYNFDDATLTAEVTYENSSSPRYTSLPSVLTIPETVVNYTGKAYKVTSIGQQAFAGSTMLLLIRFPESVTSIGSGAFQGCTGLASIVIPNSVKSIGATAFSGCTGLTSLTIPSSVSQMGENAFGNCENVLST